MLRGLPGAGFTSSCRGHWPCGKGQHLMIGLWEALTLAHTAFSGMGRSARVPFTCVYFEVYTLPALVSLNWFLAQLDIGLTSLVGPTGVGRDMQSLVMATVWLGRFTAALRSGLVVGGSPRGIRSAKDQAGARMVASDFQHDSKGSPKLVGC